MRDGYRWPTFEDYIQWENPKFLYPPLRAQDVRVAVVSRVLGGAAAGELDFSSTT